MNKPAARTGAGLGRYSPSSWADGPFRWLRSGRALLRPARDGSFTTSTAVAALVAAFERIAATRMAGLPLNNPALRVAAVGFRPWEQGTGVGVLVTPWALNLVVVSAARDAALRLAPDCRQQRDFPSGSYDFLGGEEPECGAFQFCSLFSPAFEFRDQDSAAEVAGIIMAELFADASPPASDAREAARLSGRPLAQVPTTRRGFLQGVFGGLKG